MSKRAEQVLASLRPRAEGVAGSNPENMDCHGTEVPRNDEFPIRQVDLAQELGCSRWTIGRAIKRLKEAGLLVETGRDKQSRCKIYALQAPSPLGGEGLGVRFTVEKGSGDEGWIAASATPPRNDEIPLCQRGEIQLQNYRRTFELNFIHWPDWEKHYAAVTWELKDVECIHKLFRQTFDRLYEIRDKSENCSEYGLELDYLVKSNGAG